MVTILAPYANMMRTLLGALQGTAKFAVACVPVAEWMLRQFIARPKLCMFTVTCAAGALHFRRHKGYYTSLAISLTRPHANTHLSWNPQHIARYFRDRMLYAATISYGPTRHDQVLKDLPMCSTGSARDRFTATAASMSEVLRLRPYHHQMGERDTGAGSRQYYWPADLSIPPRVDAINPRGDLVTIVDTDYYMDMNDWFVTNPAITMVYTMSPSVAAFHDQKLAYTFTKTGELEVRYPENASFAHPLWDYAPDHLILGAAWWNPLGTVACYKLIKQRLDMHHILVLFVPVWVGPAWLRLFAPVGQPLRRFNPVDGAFARLRTLQNDEWVVSTAALNTHTAVTIPLRVDNEIQVLCSQTVSALAISTIESHLRAYDVKDAKCCATILAAYYRKAAPVSAAPYVPVGRAVRTFQAFTADHDPDAKCKMTAFMQPLVHEAFTPVTSLANDKWCIDGRLRAVKKDAPLTPALEQYAKEFIRRFLGTAAHTLVPVSPDEVLLRQQRPTQRAILGRADAAASDDPHETVVQSFQKAEAYAGPLPPRNISTVEPYVKLQYSRFIYALADYLKLAPWYAFGRTPAQVARYVADLCNVAMNIVSSDFSKFDGTISPALREFEAMLLSHAFVDQYKAEALHLARTQTNRRAFTAMGECYETGTSRLSGSPETSAFNSLANALIAYTAYRMMGKQPDDAYRLLGIYGGDDGLSPDMVPETFIEAAAAWGPIAKCEAVLRGDAPVCFLARHYTPDVWCGDPNSMCDLPRQLSKLHVTGHSTDAPIVKLTEKLRGYIVSDYFTPVFHDLFLRAIQLDLDLLIPPTADYTQYNARAYTLDCQYPNLACDWFYTHAEEVMPDLDIELLRSWLATCAAPEDLLRAPLLLAPKPPLIKSDRPVDVDGESAAATQPLPAATAEPTRNSSVPKRAGPPALPPRPSSVPKRAGPPALPPRPSAKATRTRKQSRAPPPPPLLPTPTSRPKIVRVLRSGPPPPAATQSKRQVRSNHRAVKYAITRK